ncbi:MAG: DUF3786 domain-containing protein [Desulfocapsaceae bacterium]|nr:DUF3786 domain-containing protein [Desulfocapsaceae bacterium]
MALSVVDLYRTILPKTNCRDCGFPTCLAFASMVVSEKHPLKDCLHIPPDILARCEEELARQYAEGKWLKKDLADEALKWARSRAASMAVSDLPERIGGDLVQDGQVTGLRLPYFSDYLDIVGTTVRRSDGTELTRLEQVFILNHLAQGGRAMPTGRWKGFVEFPNTVSKLVSMKAQVEEPLVKCFTGKREVLQERAMQLGAIPLAMDEGSADVAVLFSPLPRVPVALLFWDAPPGEGFQAQVKLMFDETILEHLDIESIVFLSERIRLMLCDGVSC